MDSSRVERPLAVRGRRLLAALLAGLLLTPLAWADEKDVAAGSLAAAIREAGYACEHVTGMERSKDGVAEGLTVWVAQCNSGKYRVTFKGDAGSEVVRLD
ncbi:MAG: hypothetical protein R3286_00835 [Gammaproteobacteria bacterium]|nr:hypothetical protein [Gammaproteobacteria bacterium]